MLKRFIPVRPLYALRTIASDQRGVALLEFALVAPLLLLMIGGLLSLSNYLRASTTIHSHAREAARGVAMGYMTVAEAKGFAETRASRDLHVIVTVAIDPATRNDPSDPDVRVTLEISENEAGKLTPFLNIMAGRISSSVVVRAIAE